MNQAEALRPDVVLVDLGLCRNDGLETIGRLRTSWPGLGIIALTLLDSHGYCRAARAFGADDCVPKVTLNGDLPPAIRYLIPAAGWDLPKLETKHVPAKLEYDVPDGPRHDPRPPERQNRDKSQR